MFSGSFGNNRATEKYLDGQKPRKLPWVSWIYFAILLCVYTQLITYGIAIHTEFYKSVARTVFFFFLTQEDFEELKRTLYNPPISLNILKDSNPNKKTVPPIRISIFHVEESE